MFVLKLLARIPLSVLYGFSNILFRLLLVSGYRRKVIRENLKRAFPEYSHQTITKITRQFYRNLADIIVETLKTLAIAPAELQKRVVITNPELFDHYSNKNQSIIALTSHNGNWEWLLTACSLHLKFWISAVYQPLNNKFFNDLMLRIRGQFGAKMVPKKHLFRALTQLQSPSLVALVADQSPKDAPSLHWVSFLNRPTAFYTGAERIARRTGLPVLYAHMEKLKKGYYQITLKHITDEPQNTPENYITEQYAALLEEAIRKNPSQWLWSHKRWKLNDNLKTGNNNSTQFDFP